MDGWGTSSEVDLHEIKHGQSDVESQRNMYFSMQLCMCLLNLQPFLQLFCTKVAMMKKQKQQQHSAKNKQNKQTNKQKTMNHDPKLNQKPNYFPWQKCSYIQLNYHNQAD